MNQRLLKEARSLLPVWIVGQILVLVPALLNSNVVTEFGYIFFIIAAVLIAVTTFGMEFDGNTMELLLSQPVSRFDVWFEKMSVQIIALATVFLTACYLLFPLCFPFDPNSRLGDLGMSSYGFMLVLLFCAWGGGAFWTLVLKNNLAALIASVLAPALIITVVDTIGSLKHLHDAPIQWHLGALMAYAALATCFGLALFRRMQMASSLNQDINVIRDSSIQVQFSEQLNRAFRWLPGACPQLFVKELHLQAMTVAIAAAMSVVWIAFLILHTFKVRYMPLAVQGLASTWLLIVPLVIGALSIAEERRLGTLYWQQMQPPSRRLQWFVKLFTCLLLAVLLGWALPAMLLRLSLTFLPPLDYQIFARWQGEIICALALAGYCGSSLAKDFISAVLNAVALALIVPAVIFLSRSDYVTIVGYQALAVYLGSLIGFSYLNYVLGITQREWQTAGLGAIVAITKPALVVGLLVASLYGIENWRGKHAWEKYRQEQAAKGTVLDWNTFIPPPVPSDRNFADIPLFKSLLDGLGVNFGDTNGYNRVKKITPYHYFVTVNPALGFWTKGEKTSLLEWQVYYRGVTNFPAGSLPSAIFEKYQKLENEPWVTAPVVRTFRPPLTPQPQTPAEDVLFALNYFNPELNEIRAASRRPESRFPIPYAVSNMTLPHLGPLKSIAEVASLRAVAELALDRKDAALADVQLAFRLAAALKSEPFLWSQWTRGMIFERALQPVWEGLADHRWTEPQLVELQRELSTVDLLADQVHTMQAENAFAIKTWTSSTNITGLYELYEKLAEARQSMPPDTMSMNVPYLIPYLICSPRGWVYQNAIRTCRQIEDRPLPVFHLRERWIDVARFTAHRREFKAASPTPYNLLQHLFEPTSSFEYFTAQCAKRQTYVNLATIACALERYRLAHGRLPATLDDLSLQYLARLPLDIINGGPLKYRQTQAGQFVIYSVGWDEKDDGGTPASEFSEDYRWWNAPSYAESGDWVWRYPAKK